MLPAHDTPAFRELLHQQVEKRRTFAIISHPDAGKTTLTEKRQMFLRPAQRQGAQKRQARHVRLDGHREAARHLGHILRNAV